MASRESGRTPRQVFGAMIRYYRERAGLSRPELARQISKSESLIQAIELGQRAATVDVTEDLERVLPTGGTLTRLREEMGDGLSYQPYPSWFADWPGKEAQASALRSFELIVVPGLLQTEDYARALFRTRLKTTDEEIDELVAARMKRQDILARNDPPMLWVVLDEGVLRRRAGGRDVMREQVGRLIDAARRPNIVIEIVPISAGAYLGMLGAFMIADFEDAPSVGYQEMVVGAQPLEAPEQIALLDFTWNTVRSEALPRAASVELLEEVAKSWTSAT
jgi:transcriptional regulator with XRE-family HTH domain